MKKREKVSGLMTTNLITVNLKNSLSEANRIFKEKKIRHLPVVSGDKLVGIISYTDILRISFGNTFDQADADEGIFEMLSINQIMKHAPVTVSPDDSIKDAAAVLAQREFHALPVVDDDKLVGIITTTDIMKYFVEQF